jgi:hypothetical protein
MSRGARTILIVLVIIVLLLIAGFATGLIGAKQTQQGALPTISVNGGQVPKFDVDTADVDVGSKNTVVDVPTVGTKKETIEVPTVDVKKAQ